MKRLISRLVPPILIDFYRVLRNKSPSTFLTRKEFLEIRVRMESGDFNFTEASEKKLRAAWKQSPSSVPYPSVVVQAYNSGDALKANSQEVADIAYRLPYVLAYEEMSQKTYRRIIDYACGQLGLLEGKVIGDAGCGLGGLLNEVSKGHTGTKLYGFEMSRSAVVWMKSNRPFIEAVFLDISKCPTLIPKLDVLFCTDVLEHTLYPVKVVTNLLSMVKAEGSLILTVPDGRPDTTLQHIHFWSLESWRLFIDSVSTESLYRVDRIPDPNMPGGFRNAAIITKKSNPKCVV